MRSHPGSFDLSFLLPRGVARPGADVLAGDRCTLELDGPLVRIRGDSREAVFDSASHLVLAIRAGRRLAIGAILHTPAKPSGFDRWHIIAGADVAFSPTALDPYFPRVASA